MALVGLVTRGAGAEGATFERFGRGIVVNFEEGLCEFGGSIDLWYLSHGGEYLVVAGKCC